MKPSPPALLAALAVLAASPWTVAAESSQAIYEELFGAEDRQVLSTRSTDDDVAFAQRLLDASAETAGSTEFAAYLRFKAHAFAIKHPTGYPLAIEALKPLAEQGSAQAAEARRLLTEVYQRQFNVSRGDDKTAVGETLIDRYLDLAGAASSTTTEAQALTHARKALGVANAIRSSRRPQILGRVQELNRRLAARGRIESLKTQLKSGKDEGRARELLMLHVVDLDEPNEARKYSFLSSDAELTDRIRLAASDPGNLDPKQALELGHWYQSLATAQSTAKEPMFKRAATYLRRYVESGPPAGLERSKVELDLKRIEQMLAALARPSEPVSSSSPSTTGSRAYAEYTGRKDLILEAERAHTAIRPMTGVKDSRSSGSGYITRPPSADIPGDSQRARPGKGRVIFYIASREDQTVNLWWRTRNPTRSDSANSFFLGIVPGRETEGELRQGHTSNSPLWQWQRVLRGVELKKGINSLIIAAREHGAQLDTIRLTNPALDREDRRGDWDGDGDRDRGGRGGLFGGGRDGGGPGRGGPGRGGRGR
ncbi:MAG: hypothetical protein OER86_09230 [Phycisphaerae bacterium]|nr:hypothetical protein [Phycisphaerae bacterium]